MLCGKRRWLLSFGFLAAIGIVISFMTGVLTPENQQQEARLKAEIAVIKENINAVWVRLDQGRAALQSRARNRERGG